MTRCRAAASVPRARRAVLRLPGFVCVVSVVAGTHVHHNSVAACMWELLLPPGLLAAMHARRHGWSVTALLDARERLAPRCTRRLECGNMLYSAVRRGLQCAGEA
jgi:hypothetical protein